MGAYDLGELGPAAVISGGLQGLLEAYKMKRAGDVEQAKMRQSGFNAGASSHRENPMQMTAILNRIKNQESINADRDENRAMRNMLTPAEAGQLGVPYGTTRDQASGKGIIPASQATRLNIQKTQELKPILDSMQSQFDALGIPEDSAKSTLYAPIAFAKSKMAGTKERVFSQTRENISKVVKSMGESGALSTGDVSRMQGAVPGFYETKSSGKFKIDTLRDIAEEGNFNMKSGLTGSAIDTAPPARLNEYLSRKKAVGVSAEFAKQRARELLDAGRLVP